jgi:hypothetical protein
MSRKLNVFSYSPTFTVDPKKTVVQRSPAKRDPDFSLGKRPNKKTDSG